MCLNPFKHFPNSEPDHPAHFEFIELPCKKCWQCRATRLNDYTGRSLAEMSVSDWTVGLTLTYADNQYREHDLAHKILTPKHFQKFARSLRKRGHDVKYLTVGEYGSEKGRAHFHCILFGKGKPITVTEMEVKGRRTTVAEQTLPDQRRVWLPAWPHGHVFVDNRGDERMVRYVCKYILKETSEIWLSCSKKPPLGHEFFQNLADRAVANKVFPRGFIYSPPGGDTKRTYNMTGATRREFLRTILDGFQQSAGLNWSAMSPTMFNASERFELQAKKEQLLDEVRQKTPQEREQWLEEQAVWWRLNKNSIDTDKLIDSYVKIAGMQPTSNFLRHMAAAQATEYQQLLQKEVPQYVQTQARLQRIKSEFESAVKAAFAASSTERSRPG